MQSHGKRSCNRALGLDWRTQPPSLRGGVIARLIVTVRRDVIWNPRKPRRCRTDKSTSRGEISVVVVAYGQVRKGKKKKQCCSRRRRLGRSKIC